ncbi:DMT family transporter [Chitinibacter sp. SCUT-21]|uniref:DMT family transporter n=1 Tax=Chitinibacter sp. SCUT-21 TaxID=2970891 RepID=UPI0035A5B84D
MPLANSSWFAQILLLAVAIIWGSTYGVSKTALLYYPVLGFIALRFLITFACLLPFFCRQSAAERTKAIRIGLPLGLLISVIFWFEIYGVLLTSASKAAFLISLCLPLTPVAQWIILRQKPAQSTWFCLALALFGAALLSGFNGQLADLNRGDVLILGAAILRALVVALSCKWLTDQAINALALTTVQAGIIGISSFSIALLAISLNQLYLPAAPQFWGNLLYLIIFATIFAFFAQNWAAARLNPTRVAALLGLEPLFGALYGRLFLAEQLTSAAICGAMLMLLAIFGLNGGFASAGQLCRSALQMSQHALRRMAAGGKTGGQ